MYKSYGSLLRDINLKLPRPVFMIHAMLHSMTYILINSRWWHQIIFFWFFFCLWTGYRPKSNHFHTGITHLSKGPLINVRLRNIFLFLEWNESAQMMQGIHQHHTQDRRMIIVQSTRKRLSFQKAFEIYPSHCTAHRSDCTFKRHSGQCSNFLSAAALTIHGKCRR